MVEDILSIYPCQMILIQVEIHADSGGTAQVLVRICSEVRPYFLGALLFAWYFKKN
jgi:hypothetical protein